MKGFTSRGSNLSPASLSHIRASKPRNADGTNTSPRGTSQPSLLEQGMETLKAWEGFQTLFQPLGAPSHPFVPRASGLRDSRCNSRKQMLIYLGFLPWLLLPSSKGSVLFILGSKTKLSKGKNREFMLFSYPCSLFPGAPQPLNFLHIYSPRLHSSVPIPREFPRNSSVPSSLWELLLGQSCKHSLHKVTPQTAGTHNSFNIFTVKMKFMELFAKPSSPITNSRPQVPHPRGFWQIPGI